MKYLEFRELLQDFTVFSVNDIENAGQKFHRRRLHEWQKKGYIKKIIKGYYIFSDLECTEEVLFEIANRIYPPSYISSEMALSYYHLIPESVYGVTSVSPRRTYQFQTPIAEFSYRSIKPELFFGYKIVKYDGRSYKIATPEKALLDYFYLNSKYRDEDDFEGIRFNKDIFLNQVNEEIFFAFLAKFDQAVLTRRINNFWDYLTMKD